MKDFLRSQPVTYTVIVHGNISETVQDGVVVTTDD